MPFARPPTIIGTQHGLCHIPARLTMGASWGAIPSLFSSGPGWLQGNRTQPGILLKKTLISGHGVQATLEDDTVVWQTGTRGCNDGMASTNLDLSDDSHLSGGSVASKIGFSVDLNLREKLSHRIGSIWCKNPVDLNVYVFVSIQFFLFFIQN